MDAEFIQTGNWIDGKLWSLSNPLSSSQTSTLDFHKLKSRIDIGEDVKWAELAKNQLLS